ncbi:MAG: hypothetical protein ABF719_10885 [Acetobacter sp.]|uniref:hypothetical protein n=1 Tax=Acetobacter sp. TaxID=440 RepID=UPI0039E74730
MCFSFSGKTDFSHEVFGIVRNPSANGPVVHFGLSSIERNPALKTVVYSFRVTGAYKKELFGEAAQFLNHYPNECLVFRFSKWVFMFTGAYYWQATPIGHPRATRGFSNCCRFQTEELCNAGGRVKTLPKASKGGDSVICPNYSA